MKLFLQKVGLNLAVLLLLTSSTGCVSMKAILKNDQKLQQAELSQLTAVMAYETYRSVEQHLYIKAGVALEGIEEKIYYLSSMAPMLPMDSFHIKEDATAPLGVRVVEIITKDLWTQAIDGVNPIKLFSSEDWQSCIYDFIKTLTPQEPWTGYVFNINNEDLVVFVDENDLMQFSSLIEKPAEVVIEKTFQDLTIQDLMKKTFKAFLQTHAADTQEALFVTGEYQDSRYPFFYFNGKTGQGYYVGFKAERSRRLTHNKVMDMMASTQQVLLRGQVMNTLGHPVSSLYRLFFYVTHMTYDIVNPSFVRLLTNGHGDLPPIQDFTEGMDLEAWEVQLDQLLDESSSQGRMQFHIDGEAYFTALIESFLSAKSSILLRTFIFDNDDYAIKIADILKERSKEIEVKILLDGIGTLMGSKAEAPSMPKSFTPPASIVEYLQKGSRIQVKAQHNPWLTADHIKTITIDHARVFTGGMNIGREYRYDWHDLMVEVDGPIVDEIDKEFYQTWAHAKPLGDFWYFFNRLFHRQKTPLDPKGYPIRSLITRTDDPQIYRAQLEAIRRAQKYIYIENAYFSDNALLYALIAARQRGVDVRVILPVSGNHAIMNASNVVTANLMLRHGVRVFLYPGMSHVKAAVYDGWLCLGSANFDKLSLRVNKELNLATSHPQAVARFQRLVFDKDFALSKELLEPIPSHWKDYVSEFLANQL